MTAELDPVVVARWRMEDRHFWHAARNRWIVRALASRGAAAGACVLDAGCGSGAVARALQSAGYRVTGFDPARIFVEKARERCPGGRFYVGELERLPLTEAAFDALAMCDVLEHLDDPLGVLRAAAGRLRSGALIVATVPALSSLWTAVDEVSGHRKRYEPGELRALLERAGAIDVDEHGIFRSIRWLLAAARARARRTTPATGEWTDEERRRLLIGVARVPPPPINSALGGLCAAEASLAWTSSRGKTGASLLAVGRLP